MLFWLDFHHAQSTSTNDSECSGTTGLQRAQKSICYTSLYLLALLPVAARIQFKTLMLAYRTTTGSALIPLTITNLHPLQKPRLLPLTITNLHPLQKPPLLPLTITNLHPLQKPPYFHSLSRIYIPSRSPAYFHSPSRIYIPSRSPAYFHSLSQSIPSRSPAYFHSLYESTSPPEAPPTSTHYHESTSPPEAPPTSTHYHKSASPPEAPPTSTHYYESTSPPEASTHYKKISFTFSKSSSFSLPFSPSLASLYLFQGRSHGCARVCRCHPQWQLAHLKTNAEL